TAAILVGLLGACKGTTEKRQASQPTTDTNVSSERTDSSSVSKTEPIITSDGDLQFEGKIIRNNVGCKRCVRDEFVCIQKNDKGECVHWKLHCLEWETIPCSY